LSRKDCDATYVGQN